MYLNRFDASSIILCGWCWGGNIALEMAAQLELQGHTHIQVYLLNSILPMGKQKRSLQAIEKEKENFRNKLQKRQLDNEGIEKIVNLISVVNALDHRVALRKLKHTDIVLFKAMKQSTQGRETAFPYDNHIQRISKKPVVIIPIQTTHDEMTEQVEEIYRVIYHAQENEIEV